MPIRNSSRVVLDLAMMRLSDSPKWSRTVFPYSRSRSLVSPVLEIEIHTYYVSWARFVQSYATCVPSYYKHELSSQRQRVANSILNSPWVWMNRTFMVGHASATKLSIIPDWTPNDVNTVTDSAAPRWWIQTIDLIRSTALGVDAKELSRLNVSWLSSESSKDSALVDSFRIAGGCLLLGDLLRRQWKRFLMLTLRTMAVKWHKREEEL